MRTTVTLDPDTEQLVRERMKHKGVSFKVALNDAIRAGAAPRADFAFSTTAVDLGEATADLVKANELAGTLEDAELLARLHRGR